MTWLRQQSQAHRCDLPGTRGTQVGDVWQCDDCGQRWTMRWVGGRAIDKCWKRRIWPWPRAAKAKS